MAMDAQCFDVHNPGFVTATHHRQKIWSCETQ